MGRQAADQAQFFYVFNLDERIPKTHLLRRIDVFVTKALADVHREMAAFYSRTGRPSIDPELLMRMLIVGYCYGIRSERKLCEEVSLNQAYRWFCRLDLDDAVPDRSSFSKNRHGRFRDSDLLRGVFERVVGICLAVGLIKGRLPTELLLGRPRAVTAVPAHVSEDAGRGPRGRPTPVLRRARSAR
jgi:transposase